MFTGFVYVYLFHALCVIFRDLNNIATVCWDDLICKPTNIAYGIEFNICGLGYVGETKRQLNKRMCGHRFDINSGGNELLYQHFNQPDYCILSMKVRILENNIPSHHKSQSQYTIPSTKRKIRD